jgi:hypothetical protein
MNCATLNPRNLILKVVDGPVSEPHVELSDEQLQKVTDFKNQKRLAFLINNEITNFREQRSLGNSMRWDDTNKQWIIAPLPVQA